MAFLNGLAGPRVISFGQVTAYSYIASTMLKTGENVGINYIIHIVLWSGMIVNEHDIVY